MTVSHSALGTLNTESSGTASGTPQEPSVQTVSGLAALNQTTKFVDDQDTVTNDQQLIAHVSQDWVKLNDTQETEQSIKDFLKKPIVLISDTFKTSDTFSFLTSYPMPYSAFNATQGALWIEKLRGYFGIRMDMRIRLVVNANRFQQGRYIIGWVPLGGNVPTTSDFKSINTSNMHMATLVQRTTVPHVELDIATQTSAELLIPFASVHNFYPLSAMVGLTRFGNLGYLNIYPYSPLVAPTGSTVASYTVYISFENVQLIGAASPNSGIGNSELSNKLNGPISSVASSFAKGFKEFSNIPLLSEYALGASWISDRIARCAAIFGFSKPNQGDGQLKLQIINNPGHSHVDGDSDARALSFHSKPGVIPLKGHSGTQYDEMDFSYVARRFAWKLTNPWTTASSGNLFRLNNSPNQSNLVGGATHFLPIGFVANMFKSWRGSIKYRFKFVKTEFHSGRLSFAFFPTDEATFFNSPQYVNRQIVDIREHVEVEFTIPYISRFPYMNVSNGITGYFSVDVVDGLVAPSSVSSSIDILVEVAAGDDFEVAQPGSFNYSPTIFAPQSMAAEKIVKYTIGDSKVSANPILSSAVAVGDKVSSFRTLLRRFYPLAQGNRVGASTVRLNDFSALLVVDAIPIRGPVTPGNWYNADLLANVALCYAFWGGGVRIKDVCNFGLAASPVLVASSNSLVVTANPQPNTVVNNVATAAGASAVNPNTMSHQVIQQQTANNTTTVEVPQYTNTIKRCVADLWINQNVALGGPDIMQTSSSTQLFLSFTVPQGLGAVTAVNNYDLHNLYRAMADDGDLSLFISIPPMVSFTPALVSGFF